MPWSNRRSTSGLSILSMYSEYLVILCDLPVWFVWFLVGEIWFCNNIFINRILLFLFSLQNYNKINRTSFLHFHHSAGRESKNNLLEAECRVSLGYFMGQSVIVLSRTARWSTSFQARHYQNCSLGINLSAVVKPINCKILI